MFSLCSNSEKYNALILCLKMLTLLTSLISFGKGLQTLGPMNDGATCPLTFFLWGCTKVIPLFVLVILFGCSAMLKISLLYVGDCWFINLNTWAFTHCSNLFRTGSQFIYLNSFAPMWTLFPSPKQNLIHLFWQICTLF